jgi:hypothetical protein
MVEEFPLQAPQMTENGAKSGKVGGALSGPGRLAVLRARAAVTQKCLTDVILKLYEEVMTLREGKGRRNHLREMSVTLGTLSSKLSESLELSLKMDGGPPERGAAGDLDDSGSVVPCFPAGSVVGSKAIGPKAVES